MSRLLKVTARRSKNMGDGWDTIELGEEWTVPAITSESDNQTARALKYNVLFQECTRLLHERR